MAVCVLGSKVRSELFPRGPAVGAAVRIGDRRFRVIGVLADTGRAVGFDLQELVLIPVSSAQQLFNIESLFRILIQADDSEAMPRVADAVRAQIAKRHQGEEDVTVITQDAVLATFDKLLRALTAAVAGIAAISLAVAGILVMNVMLVAVTQRTGEIGLLKALGARGTTIRNAFMAEAAMLSLVGALTGYGLGLLGAFVLRRMYPVFPAYPPDWAVIAALGTALGTGLLFGIMPARRAARLDPVQALMKH
jgi:putative ABC transport system permease protein